MLLHSSLNSFVCSTVLGSYLIPFCSFELFPLAVQALIKQDNLDAFNERDPYKADDSRDEEEETDDDNSLEGETFPLERDEVMPPPLQHPQTDRLTCPKGLPWAPKVR